MQSLAQGKMSCFKPQNRGRKNCAEEEMLLSLCSRVDERAGSEIEKLLRDQLNWDYLVKKGREGAVSPLVYHTLRACNLGGLVPAAAWQELQRDYYSTAGYNTFVLKELGKLLNRLTAMHIPVILLKGAALVEDLYPAIALRPMADLDLLIRKKDFAEVDGLLLQLGYRTVRSGEFHYSREDKIEVNLDIHCDIRYGEVTQLWESARPAKVAGAEALVLSPEDTLIYTASHSAVQHGRLTRAWLVDIAATTRRYGEEINWTRLVEKAKSYNLALPLYHTFLSSRKLAGASIPTETLKAFSPSNSKSFTNRLYGSVLSRKPITNVGHIVNSTLYKSLLQRILYLFFFIFPSIQFLKRRYGVNSSIKAALYYILRPFLLFTKLMKLLSQLLCLQK